MKKAFVLAVLAITPACGYRPARFAESPPVTDVADDAPIAVPRVRVVNEPLWFADVYVRRPLMDVLDAANIPEAGDINALDEVPRSSWFDPPSVVDAASIRQRPSSFGPPLPPLDVLAETADAGRGGFRVIDARGVRYELRVDPSDRPGMRTGAAAIASRLVWALGYRSPEVHIASVSLGDFALDERARLPDGSLVDVEAILRSGPPEKDGRFRVSATTWPVGIGVGSSPIATVREDDPNDLVPHRDRRTLRALKVLGAWLKLRAIGPRSIADVYVGAPEQGHLQHYWVGLDDALGAADVTRPGDPEPDHPASPLMSLVTLGFARSPKRPPTQTERPAIGELSPDVDPEAFAPPDPFEPMDRVLPGDGYWCAKRIAALSHEVIVEAVRTAEIDDDASEYLVETLEARRRTLLAYWYSKVSPLEVEGIEGGDLVLGDRAIVAGIADISTSTYRARFFDSEGEEIAKRQRWQASAQRFRLPISPEARANEYLVIQVTAVREGRPAPRPVEVHVLQREGQAKVLGVRH